MSPRGMSTQIKISIPNLAPFSHGAYSHLGRSLSSKVGSGAVNRSPRSTLLSRSTLYSFVISLLKAGGCCGFCHPCANAASVSHGSRGSCRFTRARGDSNRFHTQMAEILPLEISEHLFLSLHIKTSHKF